MPHSKHRFTQRLRRIKPQQPEIPAQSIKIMSQIHPLVIMPEIATIQDIIKKHPSPLCIHRNNHHLLRQPHHLMQNKHHSPSKPPQSKKLQLPLHGT